ncbi:MAG: DUF4091 domain-containing protein, partial [Myxococcales bacterium]|nr:DUF4091 domain-containing protein [Myxococcales bacterium]
MLKRILPALLLLLALDAGDAAAEVGAVWALDDGTKVFAGTLDHVLKAKNGVFDAKTRTIKLFGARNEIIAFQVIVQGGDKPTKGVSVVLDSIGSIRNDTDARLSAKADLDRYYIGRRIEVFKELYLQIKLRSRSIVWKPWTEAQPKGFMNKLVPDALVPIDNKTFDLPSKRNQGVWIDVYIPKSTEPGLHKGKVLVRSTDGGCKIPACLLKVELDVLPQTLPDKPTLATMLYFSGSDDDRDQMASRYWKDPWKASDEDVEKLRERHFKFGRRHRLTMFISHDKKPHDALLKRLTGQTFSAEAGYDGPGVGLPQDVYPIHAFGSAKLDHKSANMWVDWFKKNAPKVTYFYYTMDEPTPKDHDKVSKLAAAGRPAPAFTTAKYAPSLEVDMFTTLANEYSVKLADKAKKAGKIVWCYNGVRPYSGTFMVDDTAISPRVIPWIQYKYKIPRWFYWESTYYKDVQGGRKNIDIYTEANNFTNASGDKLNGDGLLIYPGRDVIFPKSDQGIAMPIASIRLKNWRRGLQDVEYLALIRKKGHGKFVDKFV